VVGFDVVVPERPVYFSPCESSLLSLLKCVFRLPLFCRLWWKSWIPVGFECFSRFLRILVFVLRRAEELALGSLLAVRLVFKNWLPYAGVPRRQWLFFFLGFWATCHLGGLFSDFFDAGCGEKF